MKSTAFVAADKVRSVHEKCVREIQADSLMTKYVETDTLTNLLTADKDEAAIINVAHVKQVEFAVMQFAYSEIAVKLNTSRSGLKIASMSKVGGLRQEQQNSLSAIVKRTLADFKDQGFSVIAVSCP